MAILVVAIRTMKTATSPLEEISTLDDYEMSVPGGILSSGSLPEMPSPLLMRLLTRCMGGQEKFSTSPLLQSTRPRKAMQAKRRHPMKITM